MSLFDYQGNELSVGAIPDNSIYPSKFYNTAKNVFNVSAMTEDNFYSDYIHIFSVKNCAYNYPDNHSSGEWEGNHFTQPIPVTPGKSYYAQNIYRPGNNYCVCLYCDSAGTILSTTPFGSMDNPFTVPTGVSYVVIPITQSSKEKVMLLEGASADVDYYVPYGTSAMQFTTPIKEGQTSYKSLQIDAKPQRWYDKKVNCLGDSLTALGSVWQNELKRLLGLDTIRNCGMSGTCVTSLRDETAPNTNYRYRATSMDSDVDLIIVMTSINDNGSQIGEWNWTNNTGTLSSDTDKTVNNVSTIAGATNELISILRTNFSSAEIVFFGHPHMNWGQWSFNACAKEKEICGYNAIPYFDACRESGIFGATGTASHYYTDGTHLTKVGNIKLAEYMAGCLRTL